MSRPERRLRRRLRRTRSEGPQALGVRLAANGSDDLKTRIPVQLEGVGPVPHAVLLEVTLRNRGHAAIGKTSVLLTVPAGLQPQPCDERGERLATVEPPGPEPRAGEANALESSTEAMSSASPPIPGRSDARVFFRLRVSEPGRYPVRVCVRSSELPLEGEVGRELDVTEASGDLSPQDTLSALIDAGEAMLDQPDGALSGDALHREAGGFAFTTTLAVSSLRRPELRKRLEDALPDYSGPRTGDDYLRRLIRSRVRALYDIRRQL